MNITVRLVLAVVAGAIFVAVLLGWQDPSDADRALAVGGLVLAVGLVAP